MTLVQGIGAAISQPEGTLDAAVADVDP